MKTIFAVVLSLMALVEAACQPDREPDPRTAYTGTYAVRTRTTIQRPVAGSIDTLTASEIIGVSFGQGPGELTLTLPVNLSLTATLTGSSFTIPAQAVLIANADGSVSRGQYRERTGSFTGQVMSLTTILQTDAETQTSVSTGAKQ